LIRLGIGFVSDLQALTDGNPAPMHAFAIASIVQTYPTSSNESATSGRCRSATNFGVIQRQARVNGEATVASTR